MNPFLRILPLSILVTLAAACGGESSSDGDTLIPEQDAAVEASPEATTSDASNEQDAQAAETSVDAPAETSPEAAVEAEAGKDCVAAFSAEIAPVIQDLLYMSESDYPFEVVSFPDSGTGAITPDHLLQLLNLPADTVVEQRPFDQFFTQYLMAGDDGPKYQQMRQVLQTNMIDLTFIRVGTIQVHLYLIGRTECGEIAGLTTIAIET